MVQLVSLAHGVFGNLDEVLGMIAIGVLTITMAMVCFGKRNHKDAPSGSADQADVENLENQPDAVVPETVEHYHLD